MQPARLQQVKATINVTPLVDVVLVLLIIFMVIAPQLHAGPNVQLPTTDQPQRKSDDGQQILIALEWGGTIWVDGDYVSPEQFAERIREVAQERAGWQVVIKGDARLTFGEVRQAMLAVEAAGLKDVGLIADRRVVAEPGD
jgi:biopolymer transport protein ExbD